MKTAHRCYLCRHVSKNVYRTYACLGRCSTEEVYACLSQKACESRLRARGATFTTYVANPLLKQRAKVRRGRKAAA